MLTKNKNWILKLAQRETHVESGGNIGKKNRILNFFFQDFFLEICSIVYKLFMWQQGPLYNLASFCAVGGVDATIFIENFS